ncbi:MAG: glycosyltransferase family 2 protein [Chloroflexota bacterium]|nr:glycosyltransferase family 2 protein [Chloroflexota bacterium]
MIDLSIVIVSWNVADLLATCLRSIDNGAIQIVTDDADSANSPTAEIIVVDSASNDNSAAMMRADFPRVRVLAQTENVGFTRGCNIGMAAAWGRCILLLNPDTEIIENALVRLLAFVDAHPDVGIVGAHTLNTDGSYQSTRRRFPTLATGVFESTWLQGYAPRRVLDRYYVNDAPNSSTIEVDWVQGSALLARREVYVQIGGLDEGYMMYSEEMDWCRRAKDAGWRVWFVGDAHIVHHGGKSSEQVAARRQIYFQQSKLRYFRKHHGRLAAQSLRWFLLASYFVQIGQESAKSLLGHKRALRQERIRAYWQVLRSGLRLT